MLATGGSLALACQILIERGAGDLTAVCVLTTPEGIDHIGSTGNVSAPLTAAVDDRLNRRALTSSPASVMPRNQLFGAF